MAGVVEVVKVVGKVAPPSVEILNPPGVAA
jgi:hypothetical protein